MVYLVQAGYREGITAGKESALQEGFDAGFAQVGAPLGRELGILRGVASVLVSFLASSGSLPSTLANARDISAQLASIRFSDVAPRDLEAEAHAREHLEDGESYDIDVDIPEELAEKRELERLEDMLAGMAANGHKGGTTRPTIEDVRMLQERLYALCETIGAKLEDVATPQR